MTLIRCVGQITGCPACATESLRGADRHVCDDLCVLQRQLRADPAAHERSHQPKLHDCGTVLDDRHGNNYERIRFCGYGTCVQFLCPGCDEFIAGYGPVGCLCDKDPCGHGVYAEMAAERSSSARPPLLRRLFRVPRRG